ncbi:MAG: hypothetical protein DRJ52_04700 [Thermoprotei archaeon]|nr:MAG: hypothetical protein DRJ52_04700 [Thermoprotei archaeon]
MRSPCGVVALLTDFGLEDVYVAVMKAVILRINPKATIIDITHNIPSFDIEKGALALWGSFKYFPAGTVFVCVVDPSVGSERRGIALATKNYYFVGPDNGLMYLAAHEDSVEKVVVLENEEYFLRPVSYTFHGRDIFSPVAAWITKGVPLEDFGSSIAPESLIKPSVKFGVEKVDNTVFLKVLYIDKFGNVALSTRFRELTKLLEINYGDLIAVSTDKKLEKAVVTRTFADVSPGELTLYENSFGLAELGVFKGNASERLSVKRGDKVFLRREVAK